MQLILKQVSYIEVNEGWQTYVFDLNLKSIRYKLLTNKEELETAINNCKKANWSMTNATKLVHSLNRLC
jgi:DNA-binding transcriptional regulator YhcF (GntR family)